MCVLLYAKKRKDVFIIKIKRAELHSHTHYDFLDGYGSPKEMLERAREIGLVALATTGHGNMFASPYYEELKKDYPEIKIIHGIEFYECDDMTKKDSTAKYYHLIALAKNENGRILLNKMANLSNEGFFYKNRISLDKFPKNCEDLVVTSACLASKLNREGDFEKCIEYIKEYKEYFKHFYLEIQSSKSLDQESYNKKIVELSKITNTPIVVTCDAHAPKKEDLKYQNILVKITKKSVDADEIYESCYLQTTEDIFKNLHYLDKEIVKEALENSVLIASMIEDVKIPIQSPKLPPYPFPCEFKSENEYIKHLIKIGFEKRKLPISKSYRDRVIYELKIIMNMGFTGYFLIVSDAIKWAKENGIPVAPGRGSAGGSLVCFLLNITDVDPVRYGLHFERFLNPERISMPDIDSDVFGKEKVIKYLENKYGKNRVCQVVNFSYITPKVAIKDCARALRENNIEDVPKNDVEKISSFFNSEDFNDDYESNISLLSPFKNKYPNLFQYSEKISGRCRHSSVHAGGVCVADTTLEDYLPVFINKDGQKVIMADKKMCEKIGLVKIDLLSLSTLGVIETTLKLIGKDLSYIDCSNDGFLSNSKAYDLLCSGDSEFVFQLSSHEMQRLLQKVKPRSIDEISDVLALYRPDSMKYIPDYIDVKHNGKKIKYIHKDLEDILSKTNGVLIYQETLMEIVRKFGGRTMGGADIFRKGIGSKNKEMVVLESNKLEDEIKKNGYNYQVAESIANEMREKGGYSFNRSHSIQYAIIAYITAFLKSNHLAEYLCANLIQAKNDYSKIGKVILEAKRLGVNVVPPNINKSEKDFSVKNGTIYYGIVSIKNIGDEVADEIIRNRPYKSVTDVLDKCKLSITHFESLTKSGAFGKNKIEIFEKYFNSKNKNYNKDYVDVKTIPSISKLKSDFGIVADTKKERLFLYNEYKRKLFYRKQKDYNENYLKKNMEKYASNQEKWEFDSLSVYITDNPLKCTIDYIGDTSDSKNGSDCVVCGTVLKVTKKKDRNKKKYCYFDMVTLYNNLELVCFSSKFEEYEGLIKRGEDLVVLCKKENTMIVKEIKLLSEWKKEKNI